MGLGLLSADSDSINLVGLDLLRILTTINDNESTLMTNDMLDVKLESMTFSLSKLLPVISRVPYKGVNDSQTIFKVGFHMN